MVTLTKDGNTVRITTKEGKVLWQSIDQFMNGFTLDKGTMTISFATSKISKTAIPIAEINIDGVSGITTEEDLGTAIGDLVKMDATAAGGDSFYTANGSLSGDRTVDLNGHLLSFNGNVGIGAVPSADQAFIVKDGGNDLLSVDKTNFLTEVQATTNGDVFSRLALKSDILGSALYFELKSTDDSNPDVKINGNALTQAITYTADNHVFPDVIAKDFIDDTAAATGLVPIGGLYHTSGVLKIRLS